MSSRRAPGERLRVGKPLQLRGARRLVVWAGSLLGAGWAWGPGAGGAAPGADRAPFSLLQAAAAQLPAPGTRQDASLGDAAGRGWGPGVGGARGPGLGAECPFAAAGGCVAGGTVEGWRCDSPGLSDFLSPRVFALLTVAAGEVRLGKVSTVLQASPGRRLACAESWVLILPSPAPGASSLRRAAKRERRPETQ